LSYVHLYINLTGALNHRYQESGLDGKALPAIPSVDSINYIHANKAITTYGLMPGDIHFNIISHCKGFTARPLS
jgi:hypothetical protein